MLECGGVWLPDGEKHMNAWMRARNQRVDGKLTYQYHKLQAALELCTRFGRAVDVGGHCGLWSMHLTKRFQMVDAFEPVAAHRECFERNVPAGNCTLHPYALGKAPGRVGMRRNPESSGDTWVDGDGDYELRTLDSFELDRVDFIKLDCEGFELFALQGGELTLRTWWPVICVEQKPGRAQKYGLPEIGAVDWLRGLGYMLRREIGGDYLLSCD